MDKDWLLKNSKQEDNMSVEAGVYKPKSKKNKVTADQVLKLAEKLSPKDYAKFRTYVELIAGPAKMSPREAKKELTKLYKKKVKTSAPAKKSRKKAG